MEQVNTSSQQAERGYFIEQDGVRFSGVHLLMDMWGAEKTNCVEAVEHILMKAIEACGATLLNLKSHPFTPNEGLTAVAMLSESHISIHSWPEDDYAAVDIFTCGTINPYQAVAVLREKFKPAQFQLTEQKRGVRMLIQ